MALLLIQCIVMVRVIKFFPIYSQRRLGKAVLTINKEQRYLLHLPLLTRRSLALALHIIHGRRPSNEICAQLQAEKT